MSKGTFGDCLKREREMREVSLDEICAATRIGTRFLEAMENEEWEKLPGGVFNRGFVRAVARYLGLDEETMLAEYDLARLHQGSPLPSQTPQSIPHSFPKWIAIAVAILLLGLIAAGVHAWRVISLRHAASRNPASSAATGERTASSNLTAAPGTPLTIAGTPSQSASADPTLSMPTSGPLISLPPLELSIAASKNTQLQVLGDGKALFDTIINAGESHHFQARDEFRVSVSDSGGYCWN